MKAAHKKNWVIFKTGKGQIEVEVNPGEFIFGRFSAEKELKVNGSTIWKRLQKLKNMGNCDIVSNSQYSIVSIVNWETYQKTKNESNSESNKQVTSKSQASNTNNNVNNENNVNKEGQLPCDFPESENAPDAPSKEKKKTFKSWNHEDFINEVAKVNIDWLLRPEEIDDFVSYWMEKSASGKTRLSMEKTWDTRRRMQTAIRMVFEKNRRMAQKENGQSELIRPRSVRDALILDRQISRRALNELDRQRSKRANGEDQASLPGGWPDD